jgi:hypothetical protein
MRAGCITLKEPEVIVNTMEWTYAPSTGAIVWSSSLMDKDGKKCLAYVNEGGKVEQGAPLRLVVCDGSDHQFWKYDPDTSLLVNKGAKWQADDGTTKDMCFSLPLHDHIHHAVGVEMGN